MRPTLSSLQTRADSEPNPAVGLVRNPGEFDLPHIGDQKTQLLSALFDLIRNGQGHQYESIAVDLTDNLMLYVAIAGANHGQTLESVKSLLGGSGRPSKHLGIMRDIDQEIHLLIRPEILFLDFKAAIEEADLLSRNLKFSGLQRGGSSKSVWQFSSKDLYSTLKAGGHAESYFNNKLEIETATPNENLTSN